MAVYVIFILLGVLLTLFVGAVGYFICYLREEKKSEESKKKTPYNPWSSAGRFNW